MAALVAMVRRGGVRLLTLTGPGGVGKTRLALAAASELHGDFDDGVAFIDLSPVRDPELVLPTIAYSLGVRVTGDRPVTDHLRTFLAERQLLLVLDNFEQLLDAAPSLAALLALWLRRPHSVLDVWLMVVMSAWLFDIALSAILNVARFDLGFYVGRLYGLVAASFVLTVLLVDTSILQARLAHLLDVLRDRHSERERLFSAVVESSNDAIITTSLDGFVAGPGVTPEEPLGRGGEDLHEWWTALAFFQEMHGRSGGEVNEDDRMMREAYADVGAF